jgi:membrane-bound lytic murein transglycosylase D
MPAEQPKYVEYPYRVRSGDTACGIARREGVSCRELIELNNLGRRALIRIGQIITIPGSPAAVASTKKVKVASNNTTPAQKQPVKKVAKAEVAMTAVSPNPRKPEPVIKPIAEDPESIYGVGDDLLIQMSKSGGKTIYTIVIEPDESMGHYANWLGKRSTTTIRQLNNLRSSKRITIGKVLKLPIKDKAQRDAFDRQRLDYHRDLQDEFRSRFHITAVEDYRIRAGDSAWIIARDQQVPLWLLKRFNPELFTVQSHPGDIIKLPVIESLQKS